MRWATWLGGAGRPAVERLGGDPPSPYEGRYGFSRVVRTGPFVRVGGTTAVTPDGVVVGETPYEQTVEICRKLLHELGRFGAGAGRRDRDPRLRH